MKIGIWLVSAFMLACLAASCASAPYSGRKQFMLMSGEQLSSMGTQAFDALLSQAPISESPEVVEYVKCVTQPLVDVVARDHENAPDEWRLAVINDPTPNAFALPGGNIGVHVGLLKAARTDEQLAAVIGHELGHVLANHSGERLSQTLLAQGGLAVAQGFALSKMTPGKQQAVMAALGLGAQIGLLLPWSRNQESESDLIGLHLMAKAGYDPREAALLWRNMMEESKRGEPPEFLSTHPASARRIEQIESDLPKVMPEFESALRSASRQPASERCVRPSKDALKVPERSQGVRAR